eukprot:UN25047
MTWVQMKLASKVLPMPGLPYSIQHSGSTRVALAVLKREDCSLIKASMSCKYFLTKPSIVRSNRKLSLKATP